MFSEIRKKKIRRLFDAYDANNNGFLDMNDLIVLTQRISHEFGWREGSSNENRFKSVFFKIWSKLFREADLNHDHKVSFEEFSTYYEKITSSEQEFFINLKPYMDELFLALDTNQDYLLDKVEFISFFKAFTLEEENAEKVFQFIDKNGDGKISHLEFYISFYEFHMSENPKLESKNLFGIL